MSGMYVSPEDNKNQREINQQVVGRSRLNGPRPRRRRVTPGARVTPAEETVDPYSSCTKAKATYVGAQDSGPAGALLLIEDDDDTEDRTDRYDTYKGVPEGIQVVSAELLAPGETSEYGTVTDDGGSNPRLASVPLPDNMQDDDLIVVVGQGHTSGNGFAGDATSSAAVGGGTFNLLRPRQYFNPDGSAISEVPEQSALAPQGMFVCWADQINRTGTPTIDFSGTASNSTPKSVIVSVLRNVTRHDRTPIDAGDIGLNAYFAIDGSVPTSGDPFPDQGNPGGSWFHGQNNAGFPRYLDSPPVELRLPTTPVSVITAHLFNYGGNFGETTVEEIDLAEFEAGESSNVFKQSVADVYLSGSTPFKLYGAFDITLRQGTIVQPPISPSTTGFTLAAGESSVRKNRVGWVMAVESGDGVAASFPDSLCNPLLVTEHQPHTYLETNDTAGQNEARKRLDKERKKRVVVATTKFDRFDEVIVARNGTLPLWCYVSNPDHCYAGLAPWNDTRTRLYDSNELENVTGEVGRIGRYYRQYRDIPSGEDARTRFFRGNPFFAYSQREPGPLRILRTYDKTYGVTPTTTVVVRSSVNAQGGEDLTIEIGGVTNNATQFGLAANGTFLLVWADLREFYTGSNPPPIGDGSRLQQGLTSDDPSVTGTLIRGRYFRLTIADFLAFSAAATEGNDNVATFEIPGVAPLPDDDPDRFAGCHPFFYVNPEEAAVTGTYADWPETIPELSSPVPTGTDLVIPNDISENYDPFIQRVPGSVTAQQEHDNATGLKRVLVEVLGYQGDPAKLPCHC